MLSRTCTYGIQAGLYLANEVKENTYTPVHQIAKDLNVPFHFLKKILQRMTELGITRSLRSTRGGVALAKNSNEISIWDIVEALDGVEKFDSECILKLPKCNSENPCALHVAWITEKKRLQTMLKTAKLSNGGQDIPFSFH